MLLTVLSALVLTPAVPVQLTIEISAPGPSAATFGTVVAAGTSAEASEVAVSLDGGPFLAATGLDSWALPLDPAALGAGAHTVRARALGIGGAAVFDEVSFIYGPPATGESELTYVSSVDGFPLTSRLYLPSGFDTEGAPVPVVCHLHGAGGAGRINTVMRIELESRGWIGVAPDGRAWDVAGLGCSWPFSPAYFDSSDPVVGPGEQDILDVLDWLERELPVDTDRVYLTGFSYGGRGAYMIGLKNPDRFAAIAPTGAPTDMYEVDVRRPDTEGCRAVLLGGVPGDSDLIDTRFTTTSARFLLENADQLPIYHGHGLLDSVASNDPGVAPYLHGWHVVNDTSWDGCHDGVRLCFGHTPTLSELSARHPDGYDWAYMFTPVGHVADPRWSRGTSAAAGLFGTPDPLAPGRLVGIYDFFERRERITSPERIVYKTYETDHRKAYWLELETAVPRTDTPAAVRASRDASANSLALEMVRAAAVTVDLEAAQLSLDLDEPLTLQLSQLDEPVYDPALTSTSSSDLTLVSLARPESVVGVTVTLNGSALPPGSAALLDESIAIGPVDVTSASQMVVMPFVKTCPGTQNSSGAVATLRPAGTASLTRNDLAFDLAGLPPGAAAIVFYGFGQADAPLGDGRLCVAPPLFRLPAVLVADASGSASLGADLTRSPLGGGAGAVLAGSTAHFQAWHRDAAGTTGSNATDAVATRFAQ